MAVDDTRKYLKMQPLPVKYVPVVSSQYTVNDAGSCQIQGARFNNSHKLFRRWEGPCERSSITDIWSVIWLFTADGDPPILSTS